MTVVFEDLDAPGGGTPPATIKVTLWGAGQPIVGRQVSTGRFIGGTANIFPDAAGYWELNLAGNDDIVPDGTTYRIDHTFGCDTFTTYIDVPVTGGPFPTQQIEVDAMNSIAAPQLSIHAADVLLHGGGIELDYADLKSSTVVTGTAANEAQFPGVIVTVPDVARPVYLYGDAPLAQQSGGPTVGELALHLTDGAFGIFTNLDTANVKSMATTDTGIKAIVSCRLPPHSPGDYSLCGRGTSGNFTMVVSASVLGPAKLCAIAR